MSKCHDRRNFLGLRLMPPTLCFFDERFLHKLVHHVCSGLNTSSVEMPTPGLLNCSQLVRPSGATLNAIMATMRCHLMQAWSKRGPRVAKRRQHAVLEGSRERQEDLWRVSGGLHKLQCGSQVVSKASPDRPRAL